MARSVVATSPWSRYSRSKPSSSLVGISGSGTYDPASMTRTARPASASLAATTPPPAPLPTTTTSASSSSGSDAAVIGQRLHGRRRPRSTGSLHQLVAHDRPRRVGAVGPGVGVGEEGAKPLEGLERRAAHGERAEGPAAQDRLARRRVGGRGTSAGRRPSAR